MADKFIKRYPRWRLRLGPSGAWRIEWIASEGSKSRLIFLRPSYNEAVDRLIISLKSEHRIFKTKAGNNDRR